jgi:hypothetical protein
VNPKLELGQISLGMLVKIVITNDMIDDFKKDIVRRTMRRMMWKCISRIVVLVFLTLVEGQ